MKHNRTFLCFILTAAFLLPACGQGEAETTDSGTIIMSAMRDEMKRNLEGLDIEGMEQPFFISYNLFDVTTVEIIASLGSIVRSDESRNRHHAVRVMVGGYELNDENFQGTGMSGGSSMIRSSNRPPLEDDYSGIRRALWIATDNTYKNAAELFEHKKAALKQQTVSEEAKLDDFSRAPVVIHSEAPGGFDIDRARWEEAACGISRVFASYPDIYSSLVRLYFYRGDMYFVNSEGTEVVQPMTLAAVQINAYTQAVDGEPLSNHATLYCPLPEDIPPVKTLVRTAETTAEELISLRDAPVFDDSYFGPVLLDGQAVAEFFAQRLFSSKNGLIASRSPITENAGRFGYREEDTTLDDRMERRILSRDITIAALPGLERFGNLDLIGASRVDLEGVRPPEKLVLVENGILKTLLTNRTPTPKVRASNGHQRPVIGSGYWTSGTIGPSVISISTSQGQSRADMKRELLKRAKEEGFDYGIVIRRLQPMVTGAQYYDPMVRMTLSYGRRDGTTITEPVLVYRVYVEDGREELVRSVSPGTVSLSTLRHIVGASKKQFAYNTLATAGWSSGVPASFIVPDTILLEELEVKKQKRDYTPKLPVVSSPLARK